MSHSVKENIKQAFTLRPQAATASANGTGVDTLGYDSAMITLEVGTVSGTTPTLDVKMQHSDDNSSFSDISGATFTQVTASNASKTLNLSLGGARKRYIRAVATIAGTTPNFALAVNVLMGRSDVAPVGNAAA